MTNTRLLACAEYVQGKWICDVGTDHAQLPVYLVQNQKAEKALACDVRKGPLQSAEQTIRKAGLQNQIQTILSDGLQNVPGEGLTDIVIAGMGGETMIHILETCPFSLEKINLVLQPMSKAELLRAWLYEHGFAIQQETCIRDGQFLYAVMRVCYSGICRKATVSEQYFGGMNLSDPVCRSYAERIVTKLKKANYHETTERSAQIQKLEELLKCIQ